MSSSANSGSALKMIRLLTRIWAGLAASFLIFMYLAHVISSNWSFWPAGTDAIPFVFFPVGVAVGLVIAMKWEGLGGLLTVISMAVWHIIMNAAYGKPDWDFFIDGLAMPGLVFMVICLLSRIKRWYVNTYK